MEPTDEHKNWAYFLRDRINQDAKVFSYKDDNGKIEIAVFSGTIDNDYYASTVGLMDVVQANSEKPIRTEIVMTRKGTDEYLANVVSTIAFFVIKDGWRISPGIIFERMVQMYDSNTKLPHIVFAPIYQWDDMSRVVVGKHTIYPLLAIPISDSEADFVSNNGFEALGSIWEKSNIDVFNWSRVSLKNS